MGVSFPADLSSLLFQISICGHWLKISPTSAHRVKAVRTKLNKNIFPLPAF